MKALVTGGAGFLGACLVRHLLEAGYNVRSFSRSNQLFIRDLGVEVVQGDIVDQQAVARACEDCDLVFHVAAKVGIWGRYKDYYAVNVCGTGNIVRACRSLRIDRLVYTSTPSVMFNGEDRDGVDETVPYPSRYKASYPETKAIAEAIVLAENSASLATAVLRPHLIWGPNDPHLTSAILDRGRRGTLCRIGFDAKVVDFTYVTMLRTRTFWLPGNCGPDQKSLARRFLLATESQPHYGTL